MEAKDPPVVTEESDWARATRFMNESPPGTVFDQGLLAGLIAAVRREARESTRSKAPLEPSAVDRLKTCVWACEQDIADLEPRLQGDPYGPVARSIIRLEAKREAYLDAISIVEKAASPVSRREHRREAMRDGRRLDPCPRHGAIPGTVAHRLAEEERDAQAGSASKSGVDYEDLDPGIRETVRRLVAAGYETIDSGDGVSKPAAGNDECETEPHVYMSIDPVKMVEEASRLNDFLLDADVHAPDMRIQASYSPLDGHAVLSVHNVNDQSWPARTNDGGGRDG